jgi:hypothetical protein
MLTDADVSRSGSALPVFTVRLARVMRNCAAGAHFTCFTGTKVQILSQKEVQRATLLQLSSIALKPEDAELLSLLALLVQTHKY